MATGRLPDPNTAPLTAKGDLYTYSTVPARLAVGSNGDTLVADSSATTGLRWQGNFAAGKNAIINGDMRIWQRGTSFTTTTVGYFYTADRWRGYHFGGSTTISQQSFTAGTAPVAGYEGQFFLRVNQNNTATYLEQPIEDVRTFAGQTITISFWAKAASSMTFTVGVDQNFGSGGSATVTTTGSATVGTSWARSTVTLTVPSISGKTIGTGSNLALKFSSSTLSTNFDLWGVQVEAGNVATAFQTATGTLAGELAACQRYYYRSTPGKNFGHYGYASSYSTSATRAIINLPVTMRVVPTSVESSNIGLGLWGVTDYTITGLTLISDNSSFNVAVIETTGSTGLTAQRIYQVENFNNTAGYLAFSAEL